MMYKQILLAFALFLAVPALASAATLSVSPSTGTFNVGDTITVSIILNTTGQSVDGADVTYLNFNPAMLKAESITPGTLMPITASNNINNTLGRIQFSQLTSGGVKYSGQGTLATVTFKAIGGGSAQATFSFSPGSTVDTNVSAGGTDALTSVTNGSYTISGPAAPGGAPGGGGGSSLSESQIQAIIGLLQSFGADQQIITNVGNNLRGITTGGGGVVVPGYGRLTATLRVGMRSEQVTILQQFLSRDPSVYTGPVTGYFGPLTRAAVIKFQAKYGISQVGTVGPITRTKLNELYGN